MSQYKAIPQPTDQRNVSQNDILTNFNYLSTPLNPGAGVPQGILPVDHFATGDNVANPTDGFHKQISFKDQSTPASLTNAINSQNSSSIAYTKTDGAGSSQIRFLNSNMDQPVTYLKAAVAFDNTGALLGNAFNVSGVVNNSNGIYTITFSTALLSTSYLVFGSTTSSSGAGTRLFSAKTKNLGTLVVQFFNSATSVLSNPSNAEIMVIGFF